MHGLFGVERMKLFLVDSGQWVVKSVKSLTNCQLPAIHLLSVFITGTFSYLIFVL